GWHLDRCKFDEMLLTAAVEGGAVLQRGTTVTSWSQAAADHWSLVFTGRTGEQARIGARFVGDATRRKRWFARRQGAKEAAHDSLVGWVALLSKEDRTADNDSLTLVEAVEEGWWYLALIPGGKVVAAFMSDPDLGWAKRITKAGIWMDLLKRTTHVRRRVERFGYQIEIGPRMIQANSSYLNPATGRYWLAAGDAAAAFDPLSSQGTLNAMETGMQGALAIEQCLQGRRDALKEYGLKIGEALGSYVVNKQFYYREEGRWPESLFWLRRTHPQFQHGYGGSDVTTR